VAAAHLPEKVPPGQRLSESDLVEGIRARGRTAEFIPTVEGIVTRLGSMLRPGDVVVILSNGGFGGIHGRLLTALQETNPV
jgi:UDP-N-acetylmuramate: L-alanyl-gamma-D-glutamyl-meso-diaminopimelate ligase